MTELLMCTVGGAPEPVLKSILAAGPPEKVIFVCSQESRQTVDGREAGQGPNILESLRAQGLDLSPARYRIVVLSDPQDLTACVREMDRHLTPEAREWIRRGEENFTVTVDITGGTKCMSAAIALVARRWHCNLRYVGGDKRNKEGLGVVLGGHEKLLVSVNPLEALGHQVAEDAVTLCLGHHYARAQQLLEEARGRSSRAVARSLGTLAQLAGALAAWDRFDHRRAANALEQVERNQNDLPCFLAQESADEIQRGLPRWQQHLQALAAAQAPSLELIADLLANAERRGQEQRFEDGVARLYRAIEALAQWQLASRWDIPDTGRVPIAQLPREAQRQFADKERNGLVQLALQNCYWLLGALGDPLGARFAELGLRDPKASPLVARNASILAHGFQAASRDTFQQLWDRTLPLAETAGIRPQDLPRFPVLKHRSA